MKTFIATGFQGELYKLGLDTLDNYKVHDKYARDGITINRPQLTPLYEGNLDFEPVILKGSNPTVALQSYYENVVQDKRYNSGVFGDFMRVIEFNNTYILTELAPKGFEKPGIATDVGIVIRGSDYRDEESIVLITGVRKNNPGKGKLAWLGGFCDVSKDKNGVYQLDSGMYTLAKEAKEEAGITITGRENDDLENARYDYNRNILPIQLNIADKNYNANIYYLKTIKTSDKPLAEGGEVLENNKKRVYQSSGHLCLVDDLSININDLTNSFQAGDDIVELKFIDITNFVRKDDGKRLESILDFGIEHHKEFVSPLVNKVHRILWRG